MQIAESLICFFEDEIKILKMCAQCYENAYKHSESWITMTCSKPHLVLWAKKKGFDYWPAKLFSTDGQLVNLYFFGGHENEDVPANNCFLYSKANINRLKINTALYKTALKVIAYGYIEKI